MARRPRWPCSRSVLCWWVANPVRNQAVLLGTLLAIFMLIQAFINRHAILPKSTLSSSLGWFPPSAGSPGLGTSLVLKNISRPQPTSTEAPRYLFKSYSGYNLTDDPRRYFTTDGGEMCFMIGGHWNVSLKQCICKDGWMGKYCSYPKQIVNDRMIVWSNVHPRIIPRRVIFAAPFNNEFLMTELRLHELGDIVDLFMFGESNFSSHGDPKPQRLLKALNDGFMREYHHKILYVFLDHFDPRGISNGWVSEALQRNNIGQEGVKNQLYGSNPDDLFIILDADEIPKKEMILFLKNHNGFPEPFGFSLTTHTYGFYWKGSQLAQLYGGCTLAMVRNVLQYEVYFLRNPKGRIFGDQRTSGRLTTYIQSVLTTTVAMWIMGSGVQTVGWHCSSCTYPKDIKIKMMSAQNGDFPRWGDFPEKMNETYIRTLIILGFWFDDKSKLQASPIGSTHLPQYVNEHRKRFEHLLNKSYYGKPAFSLPRPIPTKVITKRIGTKNPVKGVLPNQIKSINDISKYLQNMNIDRKTSYNLIMDILKKQSKGLGAAAKIEQIANLLKDL